MMVRETLLDGMEIVLGAEMLHCGDVPAVTGHHRHQALNMDY